MKKNAFTMIELIFVIVILGILATVALPYFGTTKRNAEIVSGKSEIASIRAAIISERQTQLVQGNSSYMPILSTGTSGDNLFTGTGTTPSTLADHNRSLLLYGIKAGSAQQGWTTSSSNVYKYAVTGTPTTFTYTPTDGKFVCTRDSNDCNALVD